MERSRVLLDHSRLNNEGHVYFKMFFLSYDASRRGHVGRNMVAFMFWTHLNASVTVSKTS